MNRQHEEVQGWLEKVYGGDAIPQFEINQRTMEVLHGLMKQNERQDHCANILIEDTQQKAEEYSLEADRMANSLQQLGLTCESLSQSGTVSLRTLASVALLLDIKDASESSLLLALNEMLQTSLQLEESRRVEQKLINQLFAKTKAALLKCNTLKKVLQDLEEQARYQGPELEKKAKQAGFLQRKAKEYRKDLQQLQIELTKSGANHSIYHHKLLETAEELKNLKEKLQPLKARLDSCQKLPPDLSLAKVKVEEAKRELAEMEAELSKHIDLMHM